MEKLTEKQYQELKSTAETARKSADEAAGAHKQLLKQLKEEFDCETVKEAKVLLAKLEREESEANTALSKAMAAYEKEWNQE